MAKFYFQKHAERCYELSHHYDYMEENGLKELEVFEAKILRGGGYFFCKYFYECGESGECGKICEAYKPRNGKNGICKYHRNLYEQTDKKLVLTH